jgi:hypothetical protein
MDLRILYSIQSALLFFVIASPFMFGLTQQIFGKLFAVTKGACPTLGGVFLHAVVYGLLVYVLMILQSKKEHFNQPTAPTSENKPKETVPVAGAAPKNVA